MLHKSPDAKGAKAARLVIEKGWRVDRAAAKLGITIGVVYDYVRRQKAASTGRCPCCKQLLPIE